MVVPYHLRGTPLAPIRLSLPPLIPLRTPATAAASYFLRELYIGSPLSVREPSSFQQRREQDGTNKQPANTLRCGNIKATIWENVSEKGPFFATTFSRPFKGQSGVWCNGNSFGLYELEVLVNVAREAKEWISAHTLNR